MSEENLVLKFNYIYLLHTREFINAKKNIYKVGKTSKENLCRFNQYPKGSKLLLQTICSNCNICESKILKIFNKKFIKAKEIGNEYFEGNYLEMIDIINTIVKNEYYYDDKEMEEMEKIENKEEFTNNYQEENIEDEIENELDTDNPYIITTYEEFIKYTNIINIILINKKGDGYLRFYNQLYIKLKSNKDLNFIEGYDEDLQGILEHHKNQDLYYNKKNNELISSRKYYKFLNEEKNNYNKSDFRIVKYDLDKIYNDCLIKCYKKNAEPYKLKYHEYCLPKYHNNGDIVEYILYNSKDNSIINIDDYIDNKIITETISGIRGFMNIKNDININIIDKILDNFIDNQTKKEFKKFAYNVIVEPVEKEIIFYDTNSRILTSIFNDLMHHLSNEDVYLTPYKYYSNKNEMNKSIKDKRPKYAIVNFYEGIDEKKVLNEFRKLGIKYFIMIDNKKNIYNEEKYKNYMIQNEEIIKEIIKTENKDKYNTNYSNEYIYNRLLNRWKYVIEYYDEIFNRQFALEHNLLKWCCSK